MINLLPDEIKQSQSYGRKNIQVLRWLVTVAFGIIILLVVAGVGRLTIEAARDQAVVQKSTIEDQLAVSNLTSFEKEYGGYVDGLSNVKKLYQQQILYSRLIRKLGTVLPPGAKLTNISIGDKDKAINLNFDNEVDGLGPTIQLNLTDQSKQASDTARRIFDESFSLPLSGTRDEAGNPLITTNKDKKEIGFFVNLSGDENKLLTSAAKGSGDFAFFTIYGELANRADGPLQSFQLEGTTKPTATTPQILAYTPNNDSKYVDFSVAADSLVEAKTLEGTIINARNSSFIEVYTFEDSDYVNKRMCMDAGTKNATCEIIANTCVPKIQNGCRYILRTYYDELIKGINIKDASASEKKACENSGSPCTHSITATYTQLFSKVDINRVASCTISATTNSSTCPVEMRAEFSSDAKFYLLSSGGTQ